LPLAATLVGSMHSQGGLPQKGRTAGKGTRLPMTGQAMGKPRNTRSLDP